MHVEAFPDPTPPEGLVLRLQGLPGLCWLDGDGSTPRGRHSFLGCEPVAHVEAALGDPDPLCALDGLWLPPADAPGSPAPQGFALTPGQIPAWVGHITYDGLFEAEGLGRRHPPDDPDAPALRFSRHDAFLAHDHATGRSWLVGDDADACARLSARLSASAQPVGRAEAGSVRAAPVTRHLSAIEQALRHITAGDIYQVNLARRFEAPYVGEPLSLALAMRASSPVPMGMLLQQDGYTLIGRSMERFLRWDRAAGVVETAPIKGTIARRGGLDAQEAAALRDDPKERAEHAMIVDLMRNDLGRIATVGSVRVADLMTVEPYAGLSHLVSRVVCRTPGSLDLRALLAATFPPGSVTGTPKRRAVEIIDALEGGARGAYTGALGYIDRLGGCDLAVAIRTAVVGRGRAVYHAGGGIVEASDPLREVAETELKARVFLDALSGLRLEMPGAAAGANKGKGEGKGKGMAAVER